MNKSDWEKHLEEIKNNKGHRSREYKQEYLKFHKAHGKPGRNLPRPGDPTNGNKKKRDRGFLVIKSQKTTKILMSSSKKIRI